MTSIIDPIAISFGSISVHWYGIILGLGALAGLLLAIQEGRRYQIPSEFFMDLLLFGVPSALIGARIYYVAFKWEDYANEPWKVIAIWEGGIAIYGALIGALLCGFYYSRSKGYSFWRIADICAPSLLIGQIIGRWGNFVNQEAYGSEVSKELLTNTLHLPDFIVNQMFIQGAYVHPTFLYESVWNLFGLALIFILRRKVTLKAGELIMSYFVWYSIGRFYIEGLRTDSLAFDGPDWLAATLRALWSPLHALTEGELNPDYGDVRISQLLAVGIIIGAIAIISIRRMKYGQQLANYADPFAPRIQKKVNQ